MVPKLAIKIFSQKNIFVVNTRRNHFKWVSNSVDTIKNDIIKQISKGYNINSSLDKFMYKKMFNVNDIIYIHLDP